MWVRLIDENPVMFVLHGLKTITLVAKIDAVDLAPCVEVVCCSESQTGRC